MRLVPTVLLVAGLLLTACDDSEPEPADPATTEVLVEFRDSSVPPEFHRSWTLTLDQDRIHVVVDSYGDVIAEETAAMPGDRWDSFVEDLPQALEDLGEPEPVDGCAGATGMELTVSGGADTSLDLDNCDEGNEEISGDIEEMLEPFTRLVHLEKHTRA